MKREEIVKIQKNILKKIAEDLKQTDDVVEYVKAGEEMIYDSVMVEHADVGIGNDTVVGQYYFIPTQMEDDEVEQFYIMLTISEELSENKKVDMLQATAYVNFLLPTGAFVFDPKIEMLTYKRAVTLRVADDVKDTIAMIGYEMIMSMNVVSLFTAPLIAYMYDELTWEEFVQACEIQLNPTNE